MPNPVLKNSPITNGNPDVMNKWFTVFTRV